MPASNALAVQTGRSLGRFRVAASSLHDRASYLLPLARRCGAGGRLLLRPRLSLVEPIRHTLNGHNLATVHQPVSISDTTHAALGNTSCHSLNDLLVVMTVLLCS